MAVIRVNLAVDNNQANAVMGGFGRVRFLAAYVRFASIGDPNGSLVRNSSNITLRDLHLRLAPPDTFDPLSSGGGINGVFPTVTFLNGNAEVQFSGGNGVAAGARFWSQIPRSADYAGGMGRYTGRATPTQAPAGAKLRPQAPNNPAAGNDNTASAQIGYDGNGNFGLVGGNVNFVQYSNGTVIRNNTPTETIIGSTILPIPGTTLVGPSPDLPGAYQLADICPLTIALGSTYYLSTPLTQVLLIPDSSVPGFDSVLQGLCSWQERQAGLTSRYLDELYGALTGTLETTLLVRSNILTATNNLAHSGGSPATVIITNTAD